jgi:hypothetical protein
MMCIQGPSLDKVYSRSPEHEVLLLHFVSRRKELGIFILLRSPSRLTSYAQS